MPEFGTFRIFPGFEAPKCKFVHHFVIIFTQKMGHETTCTSTDLHLSFSPHMGHEHHY